MKNLYTIIITLLLCGMAQAQIDNDSITSGPCEAPQFVVYANGTNAYYYWADTDSDTFLIIYRPQSGSAQDNMYEIVNGDEAVITGLLPLTNYITWMAKICDGDTSAIDSAAYFTTGCGTFAAPFEEHFGSTQHCWTLDLAFSVGLDYIYTQNYVSPTLSTNYGYVDTAKAISPVIDVSELTNPYLKFSRIQSEYNGKHKELALYYREYEEDEWHHFGTFITPTGNNDWKTDSVAIPSNSPTLQLGFFSIRNENQQLARISLDDIYVYDGPYCEIVSDVAFAGQSGDTAFIHWVSNNPSGCFVRYRTSSDADWNYIDDVGGYAVITPITSLTHYEVEVTTICDSLVWVPCDFTTEGGTTSLPYFTNFADTADRNWQFDNGTCLNHWTIGSPVMPDSISPIANALFVTQDGATAGYGLDNYYTTVVASKIFNMSDISSVLPPTSLISHLTHSPHRLGTVLCILRP